MKKIFIFLMVLMTISYNANAGFLTGYVVGRGTKHCSCTNEEEQIEKLKKEIEDLKEQINKLIKSMEKNDEEKSKKEDSETV